MESPELPLIDKALLLKQTEIFSALDMDVLVNIANRAEYSYFKKSQCIFESSQEATRLYLVSKGKVQVKSAKYTYDLSVAQHFGDFALFHQSKRKSTALALENCELLCLKKADFLRVLSEFPSVALKLLSEYAQVIDDELPLQA